MNYCSTCAHDLAVERGRREAVELALIVADHRFVKALEEFADDWGCWGYANAVPEEEVLWALARTCNEAEEGEDEEGE